MTAIVRVFQCVARSAVKNGGKALCSLVPFGAVAYDIAKDALEDYRKDHAEAELRADLEQLARAGPTEVRQVAEQVAAAAAAGQPEQVREALAAYLGQVPARIRQSLRGPSEPGGTTVPGGLSVQRPEDLLALLPAGLPRFRPGDRPLAADWELVELLGQGGFGEVWKARHLTRSSVKPVALKFCLDAAAAHSLRNEAALHDLLDRLRQQNTRLAVVPLLETYLRADPPCLMYELVEGGDLAGLVREMHSHRTLTPDFATRAVHRLATTVAAAHRLSPPIVHRDLKLSNVLIRRDGSKLTLLVADFGIGGLAASQALRDQAAHPAFGQTVAAAVRGAHTPLYASPQQIAGGPPDPRDDVHALGVIWYQLVAGDLGMTATPPDWRDVARERGLSDALVEVMASCIASRAEKRPADAGVMAERLAARLGTGPGGRGPEARSKTPAHAIVRVPEGYLPRGHPRGQRLSVAVACVSNGDYREYVLEGGGRPPRVHPKFRDQRTWDEHNAFPDALARHPVVYVTQADAVAYCEWLTRKERPAGAIGEKDEYTLPTLAQWRAFARGSRLTDKTVVGREWRPGQCQPTEPVDFEVGEGLGLACLLGNVFEWCLDGDEKEQEVGDGRGGRRRQMVQRFAAVGGGWASTRDWLQAEVERGRFGGIMCPHGWPMRDGGFRVCLVGGP